MKNTTILKVLLIAAAIVLVVYLYNSFQLRVEQSVGKFLTWVILLGISFFAGWIVGRLGAHKAQKRKTAEVEK